MSVAFDEFGRPYIIIKEQAQKKRLKGVEAYKVTTLSSYLFIHTLVKYCCCKNCRFDHPYISWPKRYG